MGRGGDEGRVPSYMTAVVEKFPIIICFLSSLMCRPWGSIELVIFAPIIVNIS
jgi:hypothetical protein